jgi:4-diphosphocytidyl-2-C-methyl-D-erythritol kinase
LGGGSSNAAAALLGLNELFDAPLTKVQIREIAATLGSDVPFFLQSQPALGTGRGENIAPLSPFPALADTYLVLIHPGFGVATAWAYQQLARYPRVLPGQPGRAHQFIERLQVKDLAAASTAFYNTLEIPVLTKYPLLALFQEFLRANGAVVTLMSGSGSSTFALVKSQAEAEGLSERFKGKFGASCWTAITALRL